MIIRLCFDETALSNSYNSVRGDIVTQPFVYGWESEWVYMWVCVIFSFLNFIGCLFIRPSSEGSYYGMVMSVRPSIRPSVRVSVRQSQFSALFSFMLWHIELKFGMALSCYEHSIKFECRQFPSSFVGVMPLLELKILEIHSFPQFSPTCFDISHWNFCIWLYFTVLQIKFECR